MPPQKNKFIINLVNKKIKAKLFVLFKKKIKIKKKSFINKKIFLLLLGFKSRTVYVEELTLIRGMKGKPKLIYDGYSYLLNNTNNDKTYWLCSRNRFKKCKARVITSSLRRNEIIIKNQYHNHGPEEKL